MVLTCPINEMAYFDEKKNAFITENDIPYELYIGTSSLRDDLQRKRV